MTFLAVSSARRRIPGYEPGPLPVPPYNAPTPLTTPTYDGSGQAIHPDVIDMVERIGSTWNGYRYWMAMTPYPGGNDNFENPSILASNDGLTWIVPTGLTNPIDPDPGGVAYNSDTDLEWDADDNRMICYWRDYSGVSGQAGNLKLCWSESTDGITWTPQADMLTFTYPDPANAQLSPAIVRVTANDWRAFFVGNGGPPSQVRTANSGTGPWSAPTNCTFNGTQDAGVTGSFWHWGITYHNGVFYGLVSTNIANLNNSRIHAITSLDGIEWTLNTDAVLATRPGEWDAWLYRPTLIHAGDRMRVWYSARSAANVWRTGYTEIPLTEWPAPPAPQLNIVVDGNSISADFYTNIGTLDEHLMQHEPLSSTGATHSAHAVSGHSWTQMLGHGAAVDASYDPTRVNVLVTWETINSLYQGRTPAQVLTDMAAYTAARRAAHPGWRILHVETIPYGGSSAWATFNANMETIDSAVRANPAAYGFDATVSPRVAPAFDHDGTTSAPFTAYASYWHEAGVPYIHPTDAGKAVITPTIAQAVADLAAL